MGDLPEWIRQHPAPDEHVEKIAELAQSGFCLWVGAGLGVQIGDAGGEIIPSWADLVTNIERACVGESDPELDFSDRLEVVRRDGRSTVVLDGAHNPAGAWSLARSLRGEFGFDRRYLVLGILADKDVEAMVDVLAPLADHVVATAPDSPRAADPERILAAVRRAGVSVEEADDVEEALDKVAGLAREGDGIVVTGSLYTVGEGRTALGLEPE